MNITQLLQLARNPHFKLTPEQLAELEAYRKRRVRHAPTIKKHDTSMPKHGRELELG